MKAGYGTPQIDGEIDAIWKKADRQKLEHRTGGTGRRDSSLCYVSVLWDEEALYFLFELIDNNFTFDAPAGSELNDCVYLYIDENDMWGPTWQPGQTRICLTPSLGKSMYPTDGAVPKDFEMAFAQDIDGHWDIEFRYVPEKLDLKNTDKVLMDFQFNDANPDGTVECVLNWSDELGECRTDSASWSYVELRSAGGNGSSEGYATVDEAAAAINRTPVQPIRFVSGTNGNPNEGAANIWDGNVGTKFCTSEFSMKSVVRMKGPTVIDGLIMATANDNSAYNGRNPDEWKIQGSDNSQDWEDIVTGDESFFDEVDFTYFAMQVECEKPYRFFRFYNRSSKSGCCQISEVVLCSTDEAIKALDYKQEEEIVPVDKDKLVNYESPARLAAAANPTDDPALSGTDAPSVAGDTAEPVPAKKEAGYLPGIMITAALFAGLGAAAVIVSRRKKED